MPTTVLFAIDRLDHGGPDAVYLNLLRFIDRSAVTPVLGVGSLKGRYLEELPADVEVHELRERGGYSVDSLAALARRLRPDVIMSTRRMNLSALAARPFLPRSTRLLVRQTNHLSRNLAHLKQVRPRHGRFVDVSHRLLLGRADAVLCQSREMARDLEGYLRRPRPLPIIHNPVDVDAILRRADVGRLADDVERGTPTFVAMGRLAAQKGFDLLIPAFARLLEVRPDARLWILGDGEDEGPLRALAQRERAARAVTFLGYRDDPFPYLRAADVFVSSSRYEGFSNALVEAMACGRPAVATSGSGVGDEVVDEGVTGWLAEPGSIASLADALLRSLEGATVAADGLTERIRRDYSPEHISASYASLLQWVAAGASGPRPQGVPFA